MAELALLDIMILVRFEIPLGIAHQKGAVILAHIQYKVGLHDIAKIKKSQIFVFFENGTFYEDFFCPQVF